MIAERSPESSIYMALYLGSDYRLYLRRTDFIIPSARQYGTLAGGISGGGSWIGQPT
jgi:hypothetical protein